MIGAVLFILAVEFLNTGMEKLADHVTREQHNDIRRIKDFGSAAVFCALCLTGLVWIAGDRRALRIALKDSVMGLGRHGINRRRADWSVHCRDCQCYRSQRVNRSVDGEETDQAEAGC